VEHAGDEESFYQIQTGQPPQFFCFGIQDGFHSSSIGCVGRDAIPSYKVFANVLNGQYIILDRYTPLAYTVE